MDDNTAALRKAADVMIRALRQKSPSKKASVGWRRRTTGRGAIEIRSANMGVVATHENLRHPLFGDREHWYDTNQRDPSRTGWVGRAVDAVTDQAAEVYADEQIKALVKRYHWMVW